MTQANARGAYVYRFDRENARTTLAAFAGPAPESLADGDPAELTGDFARLHWDRKTPIVLHADAASDWRFGGFPELQDGRFAGVVSVPLLDSAQVVGLANFCRTGAASLSASALAFLMSLSLPLGALLAASTVREQLRQANRDLADRKLVERAKGILQAQLQVTEEAAYLRLRLISRRRRTPMAEIARELIDSSIAASQEVAL
jgi:uroporphyrinogen-III synthase